MKFSLKFTVSAIVATLLSVFAVAETAVEWAEKEKAKLETINPRSLVAIAQAAPESYHKLFAEVKTDYKSDPVEITRIAALTQIIASKAKMETRSTYADALLAAANKAEAADVACFFVDQLRWCATPAQTKGILELTKSDRQGVAALAAITALASERNFNSQQKDIKPNVYAEYNAQLAKLRGTSQTKALMSGFDNADIKIAGIAMRHAAQIDLQDQIAGGDARKAKSIDKQRFASGKQEIKLWCKKLSETSDTTRQIMLLDMLGINGNPEATATIAEYVGYADLGIAQAAQQAIIKIDPKAYVAALPPVLKNLPASHTDILKQSMQCVSLDLLEAGLIKDYSAYSQAGKNATLETLNIKKSKKGIELALTAINSTATEEVRNGYQLLRDCAGPEEAEVLVAKLFDARHGRSANTQGAVAVAAKRDTTGTYVNLLEKAWSKAKPDQKQNLLTTFGRIGDIKFLKITESALKDNDEEVVLAAVRALAAWNSNDVVNALLNIAYTSSDNKQRRLAQREIEKKLSVKGVDKAPFKKEWAKISAGAGDAEMKKKLDDFFAK